MPDIDLRLGTARIQVFNRIFWRLSALTSVCVTAHETEMIAKLAHVARFIAHHPLTRRHRAAAFLRFIRFQLRARLNEEVIIPWIEGTDLVVRRGMTGATGNVYAGLHDYSEMAFLLHFLRPNDLFYDVGANVGSYSVLASGVCRARTLAFEPDPDAAAALRRNVEFNGLVDLVSVRDVAVGSSEGVANFTTGLGTGNHVAIAEAGATRQVPITTLDKVSAQEMPTLLKVDVEGFNLQVVAGARATLSSDSLKAIIIEWPSEVVDTLVSFGFSRMNYDPLSRRIDESHDHEREKNALFIRDRTFVDARVAAGRRFSVCGMEL